MPPAANCPDLSPSAPGDDTAARLAHIEDLIAARAGERRIGLVADYHDAAGATAAPAHDEPGIVLVRIVTLDGHSHVYALTREVAAHLRTQLPKGVRA